MYNITNKILPCISTQIIDRLKDLQLARRFKEQILIGNFN